MGKKIKKCPGCGTRMQKTTFANLFDMHRYECPNCRGVFYEYK